MKHKLMCIFIKARYRNWTGKNARTASDCEYDFMAYSYGEINREAVSKIY